ncbi:MAG: DNA primase [Acidobacteria bacterium]|nr:DNA primase [Acidobacteriota bacterium]
MRLPRGFSDEVRQQADIVKIIGDYVSLKKRGTNYMALCPFHQEKSPSFAVHPTKGIFKCFGCSEGGDVIHFVMRMENCDFPEAIRLIAQKSGIPIPAAPEPGQAATADPEQVRAASLYALNESACAFFEHALQSNEGSAARAYLAERGIRPESAVRLRLGYAPDTWDALSGHLRKRGATSDLIVTGGLAVAREESSGIYDRFRDRIMFPILDAGGRAVAFGGRSFRASQTGREGPKYLNSPETPIYTKGRHLYGLPYAREAVKREQFAVLVEGYLDFLLPFQEGVSNIVASLGTALTDPQASLLKRFARRVVVNFDSDPAGRSATLRSVEVLMRAGLQVQVLALPDGEDPDSFVRGQGGAEYARRAAEAQNYIDYVVDRAVQGRDLSHPTTRVEAFRTALPFLAIIPNAIERTAFGDHVAARLKLDPQLVHQEIRREAQGRKSASGPEGETLSRPPSISMTESEFLLLETLLNEPENATILAGALSAGELDGLPCTPFLRRVTAALVAGVAPDYATLADHIGANAQERDVLQRVLVPKKPVPEKAWRDWFTDCLIGLKRTSMERQMALLQDAMDEALSKGDDQAYREHWMRRTGLKRVLARNGLLETRTISN